MAYVEWHDTVRNHYKTDALMASLKLKRYEAVGIIGCLSSWAIQYRPGGLIERALVKVAVGWEGGEGELLEALLSAGWLDKTEGDRVAIHDWEDITRNYRKARADSARRREENAISAQEMQLPRDCRATDALPQRSNGAAVVPSRAEQSRAEQRGGEQNEATPPDSPESRLLRLAFKAKIRAISERQLRSYVAGWLAAKGFQAVEALLMNGTVNGWDVLDVNEKHFREPRGPLKPKTRKTHSEDCKRCGGTGRRQNPATGKDIDCSACVREVPA